jgi:hypothetical protein
MTTSNSHDQAEGALANVMAEFLASVSFKEGERPEYDRMRALFIDRALIIKNIGGDTEIANVDEFISPRLELVNGGALTQFLEVEEAATTSIFGAVGHRRSVYSKSGVQNGEAFAACGVILTQFVETTGTWRISSMTWDDERAGLTVED